MSASREGASGGRTALVAALTLALIGCSTEATSAGDVSSGAGAGDTGRVGGGNLADVAQPTGACSADSDCAPFDDGDLCNGVHRCTAGTCALDPSSVVTCDPAADAACKA